MGRYTIAAALLCCLVACGSDSPTSPTSEWIEIVTIAPARGTVLAAGTPVTFTVTASVTLAKADGGYAILLISDHGNRILNNPAGPEARVTLTKGTRTVTLTDTITAPASGWTVNAAAVLFVDGSSRTAAFQQASFQVQ
jgi:hypothetical protein